MKWQLLVVSFLPFIALYFIDELPQSTRTEMEIRRHFFSNATSTTIQQKNVYFKRAILQVTNNKPDDLSRLNLGAIALEMNRVEQNYDLPYYWGGSIRNHLKGLDCSGFIHGLLYYTGQSSFRRRFNTRSFYNQLKRSSDYSQVFDSLQSTTRLEDVVDSLEIGDIILWPSGIHDGKNLPGPIWGHVGIISDIRHAKALVTHYVSSDSYNKLDVFERKGHGINTLDAATFINLKQRGRLSIFRFKRNQRSAT